MIKNANFIDSLVNALRGLKVMVKGERNIRVHISVGVAVLWFAQYYTLTSTEWCILLVTVFGVPLFEGVNTAIERAVDASVKSFDPIAGAAKDAAAGVVLIASGMAVAVGFILFFKPLIISRIFWDYLYNPLKLAGLIIYFFGAVYFILKRNKR